MFPSLLSHKPFPHFNKCRRTTSLIVLTTKLKTSVSETNFLVNAPKGFQVHVSLEFIWTYKLVWMYEIYHRYILHGHSNNLANLFECLTCPCLGNVCQVLLLQVQPVLLSPASQIVKRWRVASTSSGQTHHQDQTVNQHASIKANLNGNVVYG